MKFTVSQSSLDQALSVVSKGLASGVSNVILMGILIKAEAGTVELRTTDHTIHLRDRLAAMVDEDGEALVGGRMLANIVKNLPDAACTFETEGRQLKIRCGSATFLMTTLDAADFPAFPEYALERSVELPVDVLREIERRVGRAVSHDTSRPIITGILLTVRDNALRMEATDTFRLAVCETTLERAVGSDFQMVVPARALHDVLSLPKDSDTVTVGATHQQVVFVSGDATYVSQRIEGSFPDFRAIMPSECKTRITCGTCALDEVMHRVAVMAQSRPSIHMDVDVDGQIITLTSKSADQGEATETLDATIEGSSTSITLNYRYVFDCLGVLKGEDEIAIELNGASTPALFRSAGAVDYLYLLMPLRD